MRSSRICPCSQCAELLTTRHPRASQDSFESHPNARWESGLSALRSPLRVCPVPSHCPSVCACGCRHKFGMPGTGDDRAAPSQYLYQDVSTKTRKIIGIPDAKKNRMARQAQRWMQSHACDDEDDQTKTNAKTTIVRVATPPRSMRAFRHPAQKQVDTPHRSVRPGSA